MAPRVDRELLNSVSEAYPRLRRELLAPTLQLILAARAQCGGDVDKFIVLLVIAMRTLEHPEFTRRTPEDVYASGADRLPTLGANVRSIADSVGIPKETVRRKVAELLEMGLIGRSENNLYFPAGSYAAFAPIRQEMQRAAVSFYEAVARVAEARRDPAGRDNTAGEFRHFEAPGPSGVHEDG
jgi:hypothetical protein